MKLAFGTVAFAALLSPAVAGAQTTSAPSPTGSERRLSREQVEAILEEAATRHQSAERHAPVEGLAAEDAEQTLLPPIHGEVGFSVGTGGYHEVFGTAIYPVGEDGVAAISLDFIDWGHRRYPR